MKHYDVVAAVIVDDGKVLCLRKGRTRYPYTSHKWEFPGGKIEEGETPKEALEREILEEMACSVSAKERIIAVDCEYPDFSVTLDAYLCKAKSQSFVLKEHEAFMWATAEEMEKMDWCAADVPIAKAVAEMLRRRA